MAKKETGLVKQTAVEKQEEIIAEIEKAFDEFISKVKKDMKRLKKSDK